MTFLREASMGVEASLWQAAAMTGEAVETERPKRQQPFKPDVWGCSPV